MTGLQSFEDGLRPLPRKPQHPGQPSRKRETDRRCFAIAEVGEVLEMPSGALQACIRGGALPVVDIGCRQLVTAGAVLAFVPEKKRQEVRARLDAIELRRGGHHG